MKKIGSQTFKLDNPVTILETASIVGKKKLTVQWPNILMFV